MVPSSYLRAYNQTASPGFYVIPVPILAARHDTNDKPLRLIGSLEPSVRVTGSHGRSAASARLRTLTGWPDHTGYFFSRPRPLSGSELMIRGGSRKTCSFVMVAAKYHTPSGRCKLSRNAWSQPYAASHPTHRARNRPV